MGPKRKQENGEDIEAKKLRVEHDELTTKIINMIKDILDDENIRQKMPGFISALLVGSRTELNSYFEKLNEPIFAGLKNLLIETKITSHTYIRDDKIQALKKAAEFFRTAIEEPSSSSQEYSSSGAAESNSSSSNSLVPSTSLAHNKAKRIIPIVKSIPENFIKGSLDTYRNEMMGGFIASTMNSAGIKDGNLYISNEIVIKRPTEVTGNLGRIAGDHVVPFALFNKYVESLVKGLEIYNAIIILKDKVAGLSLGIGEDDPYKPILDKASQIISDAGNDPFHKFEAFEFLRAIFIPYVVAIWNQKVGTAFRSVKTNSDRGKEGNVIREILKNIICINNFSYNDKSIAEFIKVIDYRPFDLNKQSVPNHVQDLLAYGYRTNTLRDLMIVLNDVVETFFFMYENDFNYDQRQNTANELISNFLAQSDWVDYYKNNPQYWGENFRSVEEINSEALIDLVALFMKKDKSLFFETYDSIDDSSMSSQEDDEWYTEDQIRILLEHYLPNPDSDNPQYYIAPQTQFEDADLLPENVAAAIAAVNEGITAVIPINLHNNHWVGVVIRMQENRTIEVIYIDPMGGSLEREKNVEVFMNTITELAGDDTHMVELRTQNFMQQRNTYDCGAFTVDNLVRLAQAGNQLDGRNAEQIINLGILSQPIDGGAADLRVLHNAALNPHHEVIITANTAIGDLYASNNSDARYTLPIQDIQEAEITLDGLGATYNIDSE